MSETIIRYNRPKISRNKYGYEQGSGSTVVYNSSSGSGGTVTLPTYLTKYFSDGGSGVNISGTTRLDSLITTGDTTISGNLNVSKWVYVTDASITDKAYIYLLDSSIANVSTGNIKYVNSNTVKSDIGNITTVNSSTVNSSYANVSTGNIYDIVSNTIANSSKITTDSLVVKGNSSIGENSSDILLINSSTKVTSNLEVSNGGKLYSLNSYLTYLYTNTLDNSDTITTTNLAVRNDTSLNGNIHSSGFTNGIMTGSGWNIDNSGNAEMESLILRSFLEVPELRYNRITVESGVTWNAPGAGIIKTVDKYLETIDTSNGYFTLKLEDGEYGSFVEDDICMGIYHFTDKLYSDINDEDAPDYEDAKASGLTVSGFARVYFIVTKTEGDFNEKVYYTTRSSYGKIDNETDDEWTIKLPPMELMTIVAYGNISNTARQKSFYSTKTFSRYLSGVNQWKILPKHIMMQMGDLSGLTVDNENMGGYSAYLNNVYFSGKIKELDTDVTLINYCGAYDTNTEYKKNDEVNDENALWVFTGNSDTITDGSAISKGVKPNSSSYWIKIALGSGITLKSYSVEYGSSTDGTYYTSVKNWSKDIPSDIKGKYLWSKITITYSDDSTATTYTVSYLGNDGIQGPQGDSGPLGLKGAQGDKGAQGAKGEDGPLGLKGPQGENGLTTYLHLAWANSSTGDGFTTSNKGDTKYDWFGTYTDTNVDDSSKYSDYNWTYIKGEDGSTGQKGANGYVHIAWANSLDGSVSFTTEKQNGAEYTCMGTYTDNNEADSSNYRDYSWIYIKGPQGVTGAQGDRGPQGKDGADGTSVTIKDTVKSENDLPTTGNIVGDGYIIDGNLYVWDGNKFNNVGPIKGPQGDKGDNATLYYYHVAWMNDLNNKDNSFKIDNPNGTAYVYQGICIDTNEEDPNDYTKYKWVLIKGAEGAQGQKGAQGENGLTTYLHLAWANSSTGDGFTTTNKGDTKYDWFGTYTDTNIDDSSTYSDYNWTYIKGEDGSTGQKGANGYVHIAWANSADGLTDFAIEKTNGKEYSWMGTYTDNNEADSSTYSDYTWVYIKGDKGAQGITGSQGSTGPQGDKGPQGNNGPLGSTGPQGDRGPLGNNGPQGSTGPQGDRGPLGSTGPQGSTGRGISSLTEYYTTTTDSSAPTFNKESIDTNVWKNSYKSITWNVTYRYLWNVELTKYTNGDTEATEQQIIAIYTINGTQGSTGPQGDTGKSGLGIKALVELYQISSSTTAPQLPTYSSSTAYTTYVSQCVTSGWKTTPDTVTATKPYLWNFEIVAFTDDTWLKTDPYIVGSRGADGPQGSTGPQGDKGNDGTNGYTWNIKSITTYYNLADEQDTVNNLSDDIEDWTTTKPVWKNGYTLWLRDEVIYVRDDNNTITKTVLTTPVKVNDAKIRMRGKWTSGTTYYNNEEFMDVVVYNGNYYVLKTSSLTSTTVPSSDTTNWDSFSLFENLATSVLLANQGYVDILGAGHLRVGETSTGINAGDAYWDMTSGAITHSKTGLSLTKEGNLYIPSGSLSFKVGDTSYGDIGEAITDNIPEGSETVNENLIPDPYFDVLGDTVTINNDTYATATVVNADTYGDNAISISITSGTSNDAYSRNILHTSGLSRIKLKKNTTYTVSMYVRRSSGSLTGNSTNYGSSTYVFLYDSDTASSWHLYDNTVEDDIQGLYLIYFNGSMKSSGGQYLIKRSFTTNSNVYWFDYRIGIIGNSGCTVVFDAVKLEEGDTVTTMSVGTEANYNLISYNNKALYDTGIDIENKLITLTSDNFYCRNNHGDDTLRLDKNGNLSVYGIISQMSIDITSDKKSFYFNEVLGSNTASFGQWTDVSESITNFLDNADEGSFAFVTPYIFRFSGEVTIESDVFNSNGKHMWLPYYIPNNVGFTTDPSDENMDRGTYWGIDLFRPYVYNGNNSTTHLMTVTDLQTLVGRKITLVNKGPYFYLWLPRFDTDTYYSYTTTYWNGGNATTLSSRIEGVKRLAGYDLWIVDEGLSISLEFVNAPCSITQSTPTKVRPRSGYYFKLVDFKDYDVEWNTSY